VSDKKKGRGVVDPWRTVDPISVPKPVTPARKRIDIDEIDHDADMAIPVTCILRYAHVSFKITAVNLQTETDAFDLLANCVADLFLDTAVSPMLVAIGIGVRCRDRMFNVPSEDTAASTLKAGTSVLWFPDKPIDQGVLELARVLRSPHAAETLHKYGVTVMMTAS
jgi:hypothetical protein